MVEGKVKWYQKVVLVVCPTQQKGDEVLTHTLIFGDLVLISWILLNALHV